MLPPAFLASTRLAILCCVGVISDRRTNASACAIVGLEADIGRTSWLRIPPVKCDPRNGQPPDLSGIASFMLCVDVRGGGAKVRACDKAPNQHSSSGCLRADH